MKAHALFQHWHNQTAVFNAAKTSLFLFLIIDGNQRFDGIFQMARLMVSKSNFSLKSLRHCASVSAFLGIITSANPPFRNWKVKSGRTILSRMPYQLLWMSWLSAVHGTSIRHDIAPISVTGFCRPQTFKGTRWTTSRWGGISPSPA